MSKTPIALDGGGPGGHPGVTLVPLTGNSATDQPLLETAFEGQLTSAGFYTANGHTFAVFTSGY